jgi:hypothetical protein
MNYPEDGAEYKHKPKWMERMLEEEKMKHPLNDLPDSSSDKPSQPPEMS